ncbi:MAG: MarR family transcriptional regulator [Clostridia bacterium]|nr:MarR family transcriptional regulator [Clostridia bacterium]MBR5424301.1 MarR family transcriptional regulator [Clostridia bacterium]
MDDKYASLRLKNQICFPLYACSKEVVKKYRPFLDEIDLTYTQYITMMVLWENERISAKEIGEKLFLDSGTLTPVLKSLAVKGFINRQRSKEDERVLMIDITDKGRALKDKALFVPEKVGDCVRLTPEESKQLYDLLYKLLGRLDEE